MGEALFHFYLSGAFAAALLTWVGWAYVWILRQSPYERNLRKVNMKVSYATGEPSNCMRQGSWLQNLLYFTQILLGNMLWSWAGVFVHLWQSLRSFLMWLGASPEMRQARSRIWNEDLDVDEIWKLLAILNHHLQKSDAALVAEFEELLREDSDLDWQGQDSEQKLRLAKPQRKILIR